MSRKLKNPCYDGRNHNWWILEKSMNKKQIKWCSKCGKEQKLGNRK